MAKIITETLFYNNKQIHLKKLNKKINYSV